MPTDQASGIFSGSKADPQVRGFERKTVQSTHRHSCCSHKQWTADMDCPLRMCGCLSARSELLKGPARFISPSNSLFDLSLITQVGVLAGVHCEEV